MTQLAQTSVTSTSEAARSMGARLGMRVRHRSLILAHAAAMASFWTMLAIVEGNLAAAGGSWVHWVANAMLAGWILLAGREIVAQAISIKDWAVRIAGRGPGGRTGTEAAGALKAASFVSPLAPIERMFRILALEQEWGRSDRAAGSRA